MPDFFIYHKWVEIPPRQQGSFLTKCHQCGRQIIRKIDARGMCDFCLKVLCSLACFENCHSSDGYTLFPYLTSGRDLLPKILLSRELGGISRISVRKQLTIEYSVSDHGIMQSWYWYGSWNNSIIIIIWYWYGNLWYIKIFLINKIITEIHIGIEVSDVWCYLIVTCGWNEMYTTVKYDNFKT